MPTARPWTTPHGRAALLGLAVVAVYAASVGGEFLNYDDDWLIARNPVLDYGPGRALAAILFDFSHESRMALGAEYLPLRDLSIWLDVAVFGRWAPGLRASQLLLYVGAVLAFRAAFLRCFGPVRGELLAWMFALHPVHVESVAWLAGRKDVLALLCMGVALHRHALGGRGARVAVPLLWLCACLSKSMSLGFIGPLLATDLYLRRRPDTLTYALGGALALAATALHLHVGGMVQMVGGPLSGSRHDAFISMGVVWLRYLRMLVDPAGLSIRHDVQVLSAWTPAAALGWGLLVAWGLWAAYGLRRGLRDGQPLWMVAILWFAVPLGPVSQVVTPLQNVLADRYLWLSIVGPLLLVTHLDQLLRTRAARIVWAALLLLWASSTALRAPLFATSLAVFADAAEKTRTDPTPPYHMGMALRDLGRLPQAEAQYRAALDRCPPAHAVLPKAANGLAKLQAQRGALLEARAVLRAAVGAQPVHAQLRENLERIEAELRRQGYEDP